MHSLIMSPQLLLMLSQARKIVLMLFVGISSPALVHKFCEVNDNGQLIIHL